MSDKQRMTHPDLPDAEIWARPAQVSMREAAGWVLTPAEGDAPAAEQQPPAPAATPSTPRASRTAAAAPTPES